MRLKTKEDRLAWRFIPANATIIDDGYAIVYEYENQGKILAVAYIGTASKPAFHIRFNSTERRREYIQEWRQEQAQIQDHKQKRKDERLNFQHDLKVGDILDSSWGYEQTNIDFYQVKEVRGKFVVIQQIAGSRTYESQDTGTVVPVPGAFIESEPEIRKKVGRYGVTLTSYSNASKWDGRPRHWTSYY